jgi:hypothetical protein
MLDYWIGLNKKIQSNPIIQNKTNKNPKSWIFGFLTLNVDLTSNFFGFLELDLV